MNEHLRNFFRREDGVTAIEYALIAAFMGVALILSLPTLSDSIGNFMNKFGNRMSNIGS